MNVTHLKIIMELLLRSCFVLWEHFCELVITEAAPGCDHLYTHHYFRLVCLGKVLLARGPNIFPELSNGQDDVGLFEKHQGFHVELEQLRQVFCALVNLRVGVVQSLLDVQVEISN